MSEKNVWKGIPSQIENVMSFALAFSSLGLLVPAYIYKDGTGLLSMISPVLLSVSVIALLFAIWDFLVVRNTKYKLTNERLLTEVGVLNKRVDTLELYKVKDMNVDKPLFLRMFYLGTIVLMTSDKTHPVVLIQAVKQSDKLLSVLRGSVEACREAKGVREFD